jgi:heptosyltransferase-1
MRIAIVRLTSLGDVVHTLPVAAAIRRQRPADRIIWVVEEHEQVLLQGNPAVDEVVVAPLRRWKDQLTAGKVARAAREIGRLSARLRALRIDVTLDVQGWAHKTSPIVAMTRAPLRIGFSRRYARDPWSTLFTTCHVSPREGPSTHVVEQNLALLEPLDIRTPAPSFVFPDWPDAADRVDRWLVAHALAADPPIVLLPSTRGRRKQWPSALYGSLATSLAEGTGKPVVLAGGPGDAAVIQAVLAAAPRARLIEFAPEGVPDLALFLRRAALVIGNDTGPLHLAAAADVPSIGLFGPTSGARNGPYGPTGRYIQSRTKHVGDIGVEAVLDVALGMIRPQSAHTTSSI